MVLLPQGHDPDTFVQAEGRDALLARVREAQPFIEFLLDAEAEGHDLASVPGKLAYVRKLLPLMVNLGNQVERTEYLSELVKRTGVAPAARPWLHKLRPGRQHLDQRPKRTISHALGRNVCSYSCCCSIVVGFPMHMRNCRRPSTGIESSGHSPSLVYAATRYR